MKSVLQTKSFAHQSLILLMLFVGADRGLAQPQQQLSPSSVNDAQWGDERGLDGVRPIVLKAQVLLDRAGFSPGAIDGKIDQNLRNAIAAFQEATGDHVTATLDQPTWERLMQTSRDPVLVEYQITPADVAGPFLHKNIPHRLQDMAELPHLSYRDASELLAEKFHLTQALLRRLNPDRDLSRPGNLITVPAIGRSGQVREVSRIAVDKTTRAVRALDAAGQLVAFYPASIGSKEKPAPAGDYNVRSIVYNPTYHYNPRFHFAGVKVRHKLTIRPGPNNPVGVVWIDLSKDSYGIHGTPEPAQIGKTYSHGCIRLTNWDALDLASRIHKGTSVAFLGEQSVALSGRK